MRRFALSLLSIILPVLAFGGGANAAGKADIGNKFARDPNQTVDTSRTKRIAEYTTDPSFNLPLTDYLPVSSTVPTSEQALGHIAGASNHLLVSGLLKHGRALVKHAAVVDVRYGKGHTILFAINPIWRGETIGSYALICNAILNFPQP